MPVDGISLPGLQLLEVCLQGVQGVLDLVLQPEGSSKGPQT